MRRDLDALAGQSFDVAVVGGGIHGAWIALRAARAGCRVVLVERNDFGSGTSANSLKVLHGGLRYLQHLDLARMRSSTAARRAYAQRFPHLFAPLPCVMPLERMGVRSPWFLGPALLANDVVAFDRNRGVAREARLPRGRLLAAEACARAMGVLATRRPRAGAQWWDGVARDTSRLVLEVVLEAAGAGAQVANHVQVERILHASGRVHGLALRDLLGGREFELRATHVVNAAGPWTAQLARASDLATQALPPGWVGGLNVVLKRALDHRAAVALSVPAEADAAAVMKRRARELFFVPWQGRTMIGTDYRAVASLEEGARGAPPDMVAAFVERAAALAPLARISPADVALVHWGLLPLTEAGSLQPAKTPLVVADAQATGAQGLVNVIAEKFTSAPVVSARVLKLLARGGLRLGAEAPVPGAAAEHVAGIHFARAAGAPVEGAALDAGLRTAVDAEMAQTLHDLLRRVGLLEAGHPGAQAMERCAQWAVDHAGWDAGLVARQRVALEEGFERNLAGLGRAAQ